MVKNTNLFIGEVSSETLQKIVDILLQEDVQFMFDNKDHSADTNYKEFKVPVYSQSYPDQYPLTFVGMGEFVVDLELMGDIHINVTNPRAMSQLLEPSELRYLLLQTSDRNPE